MRHSKSQMPPAEESDPSARENPFAENHDLSDWADYNKIAPLLKLCFPIAVLVGILLTDFWNFTSLALFAGVFGLIAAPLLIRRHTFILFFSWNATMGLLLLPGNPPLWLMASLVYMSILIVAPAVTRSTRFLHVRALNMPIFFFAAVVLITMAARGGLGLQTMGGKFAGGMKYLWVLGALAGYFALSLIPIPKSERRSHIALFFLGGVTGAIGPVAEYLGGAFAYLTLIFGTTEGVAVSQDSNTLLRIKGFAFVGQGLLFWILATDGIRGTIRRINLWRILVVTVGAGCVLISGYRSSVVVIIGTVLLLFCLEGLHKTRMMFFSLLAGGVAFMALFISAPHLPHPFQRAISVVPGIPVSYDARMDAESTVAWRWELWREFAQDVPEYFWLGKGLAIRSEDMDWVQVVRRYREATQPWYASYLTGEHHNGLLSVLLSFGIFGLLGFFWFAGVVFWVLRQNMKYGDEDVACLNRLLYAFYFVYLALFCTYFGTLYWQLRDITGIVGVSIAINHGVCRKRSVRASPEQE